MILRYISEDHRANSLVTPHTWTLAAECRVRFSPCSRKTRLFPARPYLSFEMSHCILWLYRCLYRLSTRHPGSTEVNLLSKAARGSSSLLPTGKDSPSYQASAQVSRLPDCQTYLSACVLAFCTSSPQT